MSLVHHIGSLYDAFGERWETVLRFTVWGEAVGDRVIERASATGRVDRSRVDRSRIDPWGVRYGMEAWWRCTEKRIDRLARQFLGNLQLFGWGRENLVQRQENVS